jgi:hypothetical protein
MDQTGRSLGQLAVKFAAIAVNPVESLNLTT